MRNGNRTTTAAKEIAADEPRLTQLQQRFQGGMEVLCRKYELPGITAAYSLPDGSVVAFAHGLADKESGARMTADTRMPSSSAGKTFVAAIVVGLAQEGKLTLDDKIEKWLGHEAWFADLPNARDLTVRHLLTHRGGLGNHVGDPRLAERARKGLREMGPDFCFTHEELVRLILKRKPLFAAGEGFAYSDTGYILLGMILERAGDATYYDQLRQRFLNPLGLSLTEPADHREIANLAAGYLPPNNPWGLPEKTRKEGKLRFNPANEWTGGGLVSNPQDLVRWAKILFEGQALPGPYVKELVTTYPADREKASKYGLGVVVTENELGTSYGHGGRFLGYLTHVAYYPDQRVAVAVQVNVDARPDMLDEVRVLTKEVLGTVGKSL